ncbi:MAG TPA: 50S ribosomal protein L25 [Lentisphaeria bacterium]|nr:MAG: hypothetical protein A2X47_12135 [Lentisphaerae bacterium GWF2_38_69]HBM17157.1 50S ribosomal protein L25 [Lentisphaeria bacterium]
MATTSKINVVERTVLGSASSRRARKAGNVPAIVYGLHKEPKHFEINAKELDKVLSKDVSIISLVSSNGAEINALIKDVQYNYLAAQTTHVDFLEIDMNKEIVASIAVYPHGHSIGLLQGGVLDQYVHEIQVSCLPADLPVSITADVSALELNASLQLKDVKLPANVKAVGDEDQVIFHVGLPKVKVETEKSTEAAAAEGAEGEKKAEGAEGEKKAEGAEAKAAPGKTAAPAKDKKE